nr:ribonuclease H-like domain-containing protein [Tanacetum cinerariifolium]
MALLSMRADRYWKKTGKKISIQGTDVAGFDKSKVECFNCHKMGHFARECRAPRSQDMGRIENFKQGSKNEDYALWEVIEFGDSYEAPKDIVDTGLAREGSAKKKGRTVAVTTEDMQKRKNDVKQYGNFKAEGKETLEQTFNRLQAIVSHLEFIDIEIKQDDLNQKLLTSLAPEWLMHTIVWRNRSDLDTMSLDDLYNHLKVYEPEIKYKDINQIDEDEIEEMDIKWNMALLSMRADKFLKKTGKKISIQGTDVAGFDKSKVECFNCHKMGHFARECKDKIGDTWPMKKRTMLWPVQRKSVVITQSRVLRDSTGNTKFPTFNKNFPTGNLKLSTADLGNKGKAIKASACWIWKPRQNSTDK